MPTKAQPDKSSENKPAKSPREPFFIKLKQLLAASQPTQTSKTR